ncbi:hypothetical protein E2562_018249 [Oryza meyeriana var. granulata]|uniref:Zinc finger PHD-type domain-containing protein n=1 Tax=Oryza meyeriana var. granulata TaxID=110450 RepID=A0A6G1CGW2_9ORYZ|nr:hypothetical protein E2562_018249 [Oryza meyeriana var. granulata]KAF0899370.1 hypothetical protein E2562_018249 [Oryza meyeriana var. granulata]
MKNMNCPVMRAVLQSMSISMDLTMKAFSLCFKRIIAWRVELEYNMPKISVLSSEDKDNWIRLLKPHKGYAEDIARSVLITMQMIHFVKRHPTDNERTLSNHLYQVSRTFVTKPPEVDDLRKHHALVKYFVEKDPTLAKSKILRIPIEDTWNIIESELRKACPKQSFIVSNGSSTSHGDYTKDGNSDDNGDGDTDGNATDDDADLVCAICDEGGTLLSCKGECKRAFHPKLKDGEESFCVTLGYTSHEVKEIPTFICSNCQYKQHQCFKCGELDSSHETNPKVFQCCNASCGHFYHPKCVARLLEPGDADGACELEKHIAAGMPFTCPVHWCSECKQMEDRAQRQLWLAVCRHCVRSYHRKCLPREISFETMDVDATTRAWEVPKENPKIIFIYCLNHDIDATIKTPCRDHIKFPLAPQIERTEDLAKKKVKVTCVRNIDEVSPESAGLSAKPSREEGDQTQEVPISNSMEHNLLEHGCATNNLRLDQRYEPPVIGAAAPLISSEAVNRQEKQLGTSILMGTTAKSSSCAVNSVTAKRLASIAGKEGSLGTCEDIVIQNTSHALFPQEENTKTPKSSKDQLDNASRKETYITSQAGTIMASSQPRLENMEGKSGLSKDVDILAMGSEKLIASEVVGKKKRKTEVLHSSDRSVEEVTIKSLMNEFLACSLEIFFELALQLEELKQGRDNLIATQVATFDMGMASKRVQKIQTLIKEKETKMASEANDFKQLEPHRELSSLHKSPGRFDAFQGGVCFSLLFLICALFCNGPPCFVY